MECPVCGYDSMDVSVNEDRITYSCPVCEKEKGEIEMNNENRLYRVSKHKALRIQYNKDKNNFKIAQLFTDTTIPRRCSRKPIALKIDCSVTMELTPAEMAALIHEGINLYKAYILNKEEKDES